MGKQFSDSALDIMEITCYPVTVADSRFTKEYLLQVPPLIAAGAGHLEIIQVLQIFEYTELHEPSAQRPTFRGRFPIPRYQDYAHALNMTPESTHASAMSQDSVIRLRMRHHTSEMRARHKFQKHRAKKNYCMARETQKGELLHIQKAHSEIGCWLRRHPEYQ